MSGAGGRPPSFVRARREPGARAGWAGPDRLAGSMSRRPGPGGGRAGSSSPGPGPRRDCVPFGPKRSAAFHHCPPSFRNPEKPGPPSAVYTPVELGSALAFYAFFSFVITPWPCDVDWVNSRPWSARGTALGSPDMLRLLVVVGEPRPSPRTCRGVPISASGSQPPDSHFRLLALAGPEPVAIGGRKGLLLVDLRSPPHGSLQFEGRGSLAGLRVATCWAFPRRQTLGSLGRGFLHLEREDKLVFCACSLPLRRMAVTCC